MHSGAHMALDNFPVRNLEVLKSLATQGDHGTLLSVIDRTRTATGARPLRHWPRLPLHLPKELPGSLYRVEAVAKATHPPSPSRSAGSSGASNWPPTAPIPAMVAAASPKPTAPPRKARAKA